MVDKDRIRRRVRESSGTESSQSAKSFDSAQLASYLDEEGYEAINEPGYVIVDDVTDVQELFRDVQSHLTTRFQLTLVGQPDTVYVEPVQQR